MTGNYAFGPHYIALRSARAICHHLCTVQSEIFLAKARDSYIARLTGKPDQLRFTVIRSGS